MCEQAAFVQTAWITLAVKVLKKFDLLTKKKLALM